MALPESLSVRISHPISITFDPNDPEVNPEGSKVVVLGARATAYYDVRKGRWYVSKLGIHHEVSNRLKSGGLGIPRDRIFIGYDEQADKRQRIVHKRMEGALPTMKISVEVTEPEAYEPDDENEEQE